MCQIISEYFINFKFRKSQDFSSGLKCPSTDHLFRNLVKPGMRDVSTMTVKVGMKNSETNYRSFEMNSVQEYLQMREHSYCYPGTKEYKVMKKKIKELERKVKKQEDLIAEYETRLGIPRVVTLEYSSSENSSDVDDYS